MLRFTCRKRLRPGQNENNSSEGGATANNYPTQVDEPLPVDVQGTTSFQNDASVVTSANKAEKPISRSFYSPSENTVGKDIITFLSKPQILIQDKFQSTDSVGTFTPLPMPSGMMINPLIIQKLSGYFGFRAKLVFRLQVNATRFQMGRYMLAYVPLGGARYGVGTFGPVWYNQHMNTLVQRTQLPRVELDVSCDTEAILEVPFNSTLDFYKIGAYQDTDVPDTWGTIGVYPYSSLNAVSGPPSCNFTLWAHFEDVELIAQDLTITAQSKNPFASSKKKSKGALSERESRLNNVGPVESLATKISEVSSYLIPVPFLSSFAATTKWASDISANVASVFGWSAPLNLEKVTRVNRTTGSYMNNINKVDLSYPLSAAADNNVSVLPGFSGCDIDELGLNYIASVPAWFRTTPWLAASNPGTLIGTGINLYPAFFEQSRSYASGTVTDFPPISFVAKHFEYWRGSIKITFKFVRTEFHSGRLAVVFRPLDSNTSSATVAMTLPNSALLQREIIDIRTQNEVTLTFPYICKRPYLPNTSTGYFGAVYLYVVDPIVAPDTVPQDIQILMEVSAGHDFEVAWPRPRSYNPAVGVTAQSINPWNSSVCDMTNKVIGDFKEPVNSLEQSQASIGEKIVSFRQLLKRFNSIWQASLPAPAANAANLNVLPFAYSNTGTTAGSLQPVYGNDLYGLLNSIFLYSRGGVRLKLLVTGTPPASMQSHINFNQSGGFISTMVVPSSNDLNGLNSKSSWTDGTALYTIHNTNIDPVVEVQVPQYMFTHSRCNVEHMCGAGKNYLLAQTSLGTPMFVDFTVPSQTNPSTTWSWVLFRAGADDVNFGGFVSIPPLYQSSA